MLRRIILLIPILILTACLEESSDKLDRKAFTKIYDNRDFASSFLSIDMKQTADGGYLVLGGRTRRLVEDGETVNVNAPMTPYLIKTDAYGKLERETELDATLLYPIGNLNEIAGSYYFFCMDVTMAAYLIKISASGEFESSTALPGIIYPLASGIDTNPANAQQNGLLLLSYDNGTQESVASRVSVEGTVSGTSRFYTGAESPIDGLVVAHATRTGTQYPFSIAENTAGEVYFNGFINYTFALVFTDLTSDTPKATFAGQQANAGFSSVLNTSGTRYALSTYNFGFNFILPHATLNLAAPVSTSVIQIGAYSFPELEANARVKVIRATLQERNVVVYASNTKSGQIGLYVYDEVTGEFLTSKYLGYGNPFEAGALVQTPEGDLVVSGTTYITGRLPRLCLLKVSAADFTL